LQTVAEEQKQIAIQQLARLEQIFEKIRGGDVFSLSGGNN
jgi:hypothetical protein